MAFNNGFTAVTGATYTAAQYNTHVRDNMTAIWVYTTAGDIAYASGATALARLAIGANTTTVLTPAAGLPTWSHSPQIAGILHARAYVDFYPNGQTTISGAFGDVTGGTVNIVTTQTCTIVMHAHGIIASSTAGVECTVRGVINGVNHVPTSSVLSLPKTSNTQYITFGYVYVLAAVAAGTITCKLQFRSGAGGTTVYFDGGHINVFAFVE